MLDLIANVRRDEICAILKKQQAVTTVSLAADFDVSIETIRKDLMILEKEGKLARVHGGAVAKSTAKPYMNLSGRMRSMQSEKTELSQLSASLVKNGDIIAIDAGSTAIEFISALMERFDTLTIVTHSMDVFQRGCGYKNFEIILCGGYYSKSENSFYGDFAEYTAGNLHVGKTFIFPSALSLKHGICDYSPELSRMQRKLIEAADDVIVAADSSKYEKSAFIKVADLNPGYFYIADSKLSENIKEIYRNNDIKIITRKDEIPEAE